MHAAGEVFPGHRGTSESQSATTAQQKVPREDGNGLIPFAVLRDPGRHAMATKKAAPASKAAAKKAAAATVKGAATKATGAAPKKTAAKPAPAPAKKATPAKTTAPAKKTTPAVAKKTTPKAAKKATEVPKKAAAVKAPPAQAAPVSKASAPAKAVAKAPAPTKAVKKAAGETDTKFLAEQRQLLLEERAQYEQQAAALKAEADQLAAEAEGESEFTEEGGDVDSMSAERERDLALASQARLTIDEIDRALTKIDHGTYGLCERCEQPIMRARLKALPYAALCVACKSGGLSTRR